MKCFFFIAEFEGAAKIRKIAIYRFLIFLIFAALSNSPIKKHFICILSKILAYFSQILPDLSLSLIILISRDHGCQIWKIFHFTWLPNKF